jgi:death-on-curing family protein
MPPFHTRFPNKMESCLETPFGRFKGVTFYRGVCKKAAALFYLCIKDHPLENGNKRFAVTVMLYFLYKNDYWLEVDAVKLYEIAKSVANNTAPSRRVMANLEIIFKQSIVKRK